MLNGPPRPTQEDDESEELFVVPSRVSLPSGDNENGACDDDDGGKSLNMPASSPAADPTDGRPFGTVPPAVRSSGGERSAPTAISSTTSAAASAAGSAAGSAAAAEGAAGGNDNGGAHSNTDDNTEFADGELVWAKSHAVGAMWPCVVLEPAESTSDCGGASAQRYIVHFLGNGGGRRHLMYAVKPWQPGTPWHDMRVRGGDSVGPTDELENAAERFAAALVEADAVWRFGNGFAHITVDPDGRNQLDDEALAALVDDAAASPADGTDETDEFEEHDETVDEGDGEEIDHAASTGSAVAVAGHGAASAAAAAAASAPNQYEYALDMLQGVFDTKYAVVADDKTAEAWARLREGEVTLPPDSKSRERTTDFSLSYSEVIARVKAGDYASTGSFDWNMFRRDLHTLVNNWHALLVKRGEDREHAGVLKGLRVSIEKRQLSGSAMRNARGLPRWAQEVKKLVRDLMKHGSSWPFREPVDPVAMGIPEYTETIKEPMDLSTVRAKLKSLAYSSPDEAIADLQRIWDNCRKFNGPEHEVSEAADTLEVITHARLVKLKLMSRADKNGKAPAPTSLARSSQRRASASSSSVTPTPGQAADAAEAGSANAHASVSDPAVGSEMSDNWEDEVERVTLEFKLELLEKRRTAFADAMSRAKTEKIRFEKERRALADALDDIKAEASAAEAAAAEPAATALDRIEREAKKTKLKLALDEIQAMESGVKEAARLVDTNRTRVDVVQARIAEAKDKIAILPSPEKKRRHDDTDDSGDGSCGSDKRPRADGAADNAGA